VVAYGINLHSLAFEYHTLPLMITVSCQPNPCRNGGMCNRGDNDRDEVSQCACPPGHHGLLCEQKDGEPRRAPADRANVFHAGAEMGGAGMGGAGMGGAGMGGAGMGGAEMGGAGRGGAGMGGAGMGGAGMGGAGMGGAGMGGAGMDAAQGGPHSGVDMDGEMGVSHEEMEEAHEEMGGPPENMGGVPGDADESHGRMHRSDE